MKKKYILIWRIDDYPDMGGGQYHCVYDSIENMETDVNELLKDNKISIEFCAEIGNRVHFEKVEIVTKWQATI